MKKFLLGAFIFLLSVFATAFAETANESVRDLAYEGEQLYRQGDFRNAIKKWEKGIEIARTNENQKLTVYFLANLAVVYTDTGDYKKALVFDEEALNISRILDDKNQTGNILGNLGNIHGMLGSYQKAVSYYEEALSIFREIGFRQGVGTILSSLGTVYGSTGEYKKALSFLTEALTIKKENNDKIGIADTLSNEGVVYKTMGDYRNAISNYEEALKICRENNYRQGIGTNLTNLGVTYDNSGDYQKAIAAHEEVLQIAKLSGDQNAIGISLANLGIVYRNLGDYKKALSYHERALQYFKGTGYTQKILDTTNSLGVIYKELGDYGRAFSSFDEVIKLSKEIGYPQGLVTALVHKSDVYIARGEYQKALATSNECLEIQKQMNVPTHDTELRIADIMAETGDLDSAEKQYNALGDPERLGRMSLLRKNYTSAIDYFNNLLQYDQETREAGFLFADYCGLGRSYAGILKYAKAIDYLNKAIDLTEEQRAALGDGEKAQFFSAKIEGFPRAEPYEQMVQVMTATGHDEDAFRFSESLKARTLSEAISRNHDALSSSLPADLVAEETAHILRIRNLTREMQLLYRNKEMDTYKEREKELKSEKYSFDKFINQLRRLYPEYVSVTYPQPVAASAVPLDDSEALVEFEITDDTLYIFVLKGNYKTLTVTSVQKSRKEIQDLVLRYKSYFDSVENDGDLTAYDAKLGQELYNILLGSVLPTIPEWMSIIIVPDEILGILPFESLVIQAPSQVKMAEGKHGPFPYGCRYLGDRYSISYAQSATALTITRSMKKSSTKDQMALAVCDPVFSANDRRLAGNEKGAGDTEAGQVMHLVREWKTMGVQGTRVKEETYRHVNKDDELFPRLEKTLEVAKTMESLYGTKTTLLTGAAAKEETVEHLDFTNYKYIIFATHAILDGAVPWIEQPALVLSQVGNSAGYDGFLTMSEVMKLKIPADVVALTACQTGVGKTVIGEGVMGMGRAFQYAGCNNVLMSLWPVSEDATVTLSNIFFRKLKEGKEPREALRLARSEMRLAGFEHPFHWAGFILVSR